MPDGQTLMLFDNGNTRISRNSDQGTSRGQVWRIDEGSRTVTLVLNADFKVNSAASAPRNSAQRQLPLRRRLHHGPSEPSARSTQALEVDPSGNIVWGMQITAQEYRSYRWTICIRRRSHDGAGYAVQRAHGVVAALAGYYYLWQARGGDGPFAWRRG